MPSPSRTRLVLYGLLIGLLLVAGIVVYANWPSHDPKAEPAHFPQ